MAKDEEEKAEAGEVEKEEGGKHQCEQCGKSYVFKHKLAHHKTWLCKELAPKPVQEPRDREAAFFGKEVAAVLVSTPGHWITYIKLRGVWWCVDSIRAHAVQRNPFLCQSPRHMIMQLWFKND